MVAFHPLFAMIPVIIVFAAMGMMFQATFSEGEAFSQYTSAVSAVETKMVFGVSGCEHQPPNVGVIQTRVPRGTIRQLQGTYHFSKRRKKEILDNNKLSKENKSRD